jgi:hypothetical protein
MTNPVRKLLPLAMLAVAAVALAAAAGRQSPAGYEIELRF